MSCELSIVELLIAFCPLLIANCSLPMHIAYCSHAHGLQTNFGRTVLQPYFCDGELAERSIAAVLKTVEGYTSRGSNP